MRGPVLGLAILMASSAGVSHAGSAAGAAPAFRPVRVAPAYSPRPIPPRPIMARMVAPRVAVPPQVKPHCPPPLTVSMPKPSNHRARTLRLIQQNIAMQAALRTVREPRPCDPSWSAEKQRRKRCAPAMPATSAPMLEPAAPLPQTTLAAVQEIPGGQN
ncbi:hypothetical protein [Caulobacter sp. LARHSG274]